jgi:predicted nuclease of restriction endonuclease-like RecB superfamily
MLKRVHVTPFVVTRNGEVTLRYLNDTKASTLALLDRLCALVRRLEGAPRRDVSELLRRQERRVHDARRLAGVAKTLIDLCEFVPPPGAARAAEVRATVFAARGAHWPPIPGDALVPYQRAAEPLGLTSEEVVEFLYADDPMAAVLEHAPEIDGRTLLDRYNLELARGVLLDATSLTISARGGWRAIFAAVKLARLMYRVERDTSHGRRKVYRLEITGPAAPFVVRPQRYGARLARVVPSLVRAPGWTLDAALAGDAGSRFRLDRTSAPFAARSERRRYDSRWERALAVDFTRLLREERQGWRLEREATPVASGAELLLPDFTLRHADGREIIVEVVGFWTPEYLETKLRKIEAAGLEQLLLVVYRGLGVGEQSAEIERVGRGRVVWFRERPRIADVLAAAEAASVRPRAR